MDEARRVVERLERIDGLRARGARPRELLGEIRILLREGEDWLRAERGAAGLPEAKRARAAIEGCRARLGPAAPGGEEEVIAGSAVYDR